MYGVEWEILIAFDDDGGVTLGDGFAAPDCFGHAMFSRVKSVETF
jgi:hypothetical protein